MSAVRTQDEIVARTYEAQRRDCCGFEWHEYMDHLDYEHGKQFLTADAQADAAMAAEWQSETLEALDSRARAYMDFWLEKIENERGISVQRATAHFIAWKWLLGHPDADTFPGSFNGPDGGWYQRDAYNYIRQQMDSGEWDRLTNEARTMLAASEQPEVTP